MTASILSTSLRPGARVLLVDDDEVWRLLTSSALTARGFDVMGLGSASDLAEHLSAFGPDVLILDAMMPGIDGFSACRGLRADPRFAEMPVLMLTGLDDEQAITMAYEAGATDFFIKSSHWALLGERLRHLVAVARLQRETGRTLDGAGAAARPSVADAHDRQGERSVEAASPAVSRRLADSDPLTGLASRQRMLAGTAAAIAAASPRALGVALVVLNVDHFAEINERFGQSSGDELLCQLAARLTRCCAAMPSFDQVTRTDAPAAAIPDGVVVAAEAVQLGRLGGDSFAILFPAVRDVERLRDALQTLRDSIDAPFQLAQGPCTLSASIGVAMSPDHGDEAGLLLSRADRAMASLKAGSRNGVRWYSPQLDSATRDRLAMASDLHRALSNGELELHYQLVVDTVAARIHGCEALVRWRKPDGLLPPGMFIPIAEETGLIIPMGEWAIQEASRQLIAWRQAGVPIDQVSVNLPSSHFERASLLEVVNATIARHRLQHGALELELTETGLVQDIERALQRFEALRQAGVSIAIDDFGTGYANLTYLARLPAAKLKIDLSFVQALGQSPQAETIVRAIVGLGESLQMRVVAEGVETQAQARALRRIGCRLMQGYLFARPVPASELAQSWALAQRTLKSMAAATGADESGLDRSGADVGGPQAARAGLERRR